MSSAVVYDAQGHHQVHNKSVPSQIRCDSCKRLKSKNQFSNRQQENAAKRSNRVRGSDKTWVDCNQCTSKQITERQCFHCGLWKGVDKFNKTQRTKDEPMCEKCGAEKKDFAPGAASSDEYSEISGSDDDSNDGYSHRDDDATTVANGIDGISLNDNSTATYHSSSGGGVRLDGSSSHQSGAFPNSSTGNSTTRHSNNAPSISSDRSPLPVSLNRSSTDSGNSGRRAILPDSCNARQFARPPKGSNGKGKRKTRVPEKNIDDLEVAGSDSESD